MGIPLTTAITQVRDMLDEPNPQFWTNVQLISWINQGCQDIARRAENLWTFHTFAAVLTPTPQQNYPFPSNFLNFHRGEFVLGTGPQTYPLRYFRYEQMDDIWGILQTIPAAYPAFCTIWRDGKTGPAQPYLRVFPVPATTGKFNIFYYRSANVNSTVHVDIDVQAGWETLVFTYCIYRAKQKDRDPSWQTFKGQYESSLKMLIDKTRDFTDQGDTIRSGMSAGLPLYAYGTTGWLI